MARPTYRYVCPCGYRTQRSWMMLYHQARCVVQDRLHDRTTIIKIRPKVPHTDMELLVHTLKPLKGKA